MFVRAAIAKLESINLTFWKGAGLFCVVVLARVALERILGFGKEEGWWYWTTYLHYLLWYGVVLLGITLIIHWFSRSRPERILRAAVTCLGITLTPLLIAVAIGEDPYLSNHYALLSGPAQWIRFIADFFVGSFTDFGWGLRVEVMFMFVALGAYMFVKTRSLAKSLLATLCAYVFLLFMGSLPSVIFWFDNTSAFGPISFFINLFYDQFGATAIGHGYLSNSGLGSLDVWINFLMSAVLFPLFIVLCLAVLFYTNKNIFRVIMGNVRIERGAAYVFITLLGAMAALIWLKVILPLTFLNIVSILILVATSFLFHAATVFHNDIYDYETDKISNPDRPLPKGTLSAPQMRAVAFSCGALSLIGALILHKYGALLVGAAFILAWAYSAPPFRLKRFLLINPLLIAVAFLFFLMFGFYVARTSHTLHFPLGKASLFLVIAVCAANFKDIKDYRGDKQQGVMTIPVAFGLEKGKLIIGLLSAFSLLLVPLFAGKLLLYIPSILFGVLLYRAIQHEPYSEKLIFVLYALYVITGAAILTLV